MQKEVEKFIAEKSAERERAAKAARDAHLIELGLFRIEPMPEGGDDADYPEFESIGGTRSRKTALEVSDGEYAAICEVTPAPEMQEKGGWPILPTYKILFVLAIVIWVGGAILGISAGREIAPFGGEGDCSLRRYVNYDGRVGVGGRRRIRRGAAGGVGDCSPDEKAKRRAVRSGVAFRFSEKPTGFLQTQRKPRGSASRLRLRRRARLGK